MLSATARFHDYSWRNCLLIMAQRPDATRVAGYRTWQALGRQVRRGERGIAVLAPLTYKVAAVTAEGEPPAADTQEPTSLRQIRGWKLEHVFDIEQTDGDPLPTVTPRLLDRGVPEGLWEGLAEQVRQADYELRAEEPSMPGALGETSPREGVVRVRPELAPAQRTKTLAHELGHIALAHPAGQRNDPRSRLEVEAESFAYIVCAAAGMDTGDYSLSYIGHWAGPGQEVAEVALTADRVVIAARGVLHAMPQGIWSTA